MNVIQAGLIGYGLAGKVFHAPLISCVPQLRLAAVVTSRDAEVLADLPEARVIPTVDQLLRDPSIDLVVVAAPNAAHFEIARAALQAGKHVVVDKPIATETAQADRLIALAKNQNRVLTVFQNRRWDGDFLTVRRILADRQLGRVSYYESHFDRFRPQIKPGWREETGAGAGALYDLGPHLIDQALQLFGMPRSVTADVVTQRPAAKTADYFHLVLEYGTMRAVLHAASLAAAPGPRFLIHGDAGSFVKYGLDPQEAALKEGQRPGEADWGSDAPEHFGELVTGSGVREKVATLNGCYPQFYEQLAASLESGTPVPVDAGEARDGLRVILAAQRSFSERRAIAL